MKYSLSPVIFESVSQVTATNSTELGTEVIDNGYKYVYAYNAGEYDATPGYPGVLGSANSGYSFTVTNAASQVGVFCGGVHHTTIPAGYYGWLMTKGVCRVGPDTSAVSVAAGSYLGLGVSGGYVAAPATFSTGSRKGYLISSMVTNSGASLASLGLAWIKSDIW